MITVLLAIVLAQSGRQRPVNPPNASITDWKPGGIDTRDRALCANTP